MSGNSEKYHRRSIRLKDYDYSQAGGYFITICTHGWGNLFGNIVKGEMRLNEYGKIVENEWIKTGKMCLNVLLDEYIIMPNHIHGIIIIIDDGRGTLQRAPTVERFGKPVSNSIPTIVRLFKSTTTKQINQIRKMPRASVWQRNYYEHVIRNEDKLNKLRYYIQTNLLKWYLDRENPERVGFYELEEEIFKNVNVYKTNSY